MRILSRRVSDVLNSPSEECPRISTRAEDPAFRSKAIVSSTPGKVYWNNSVYKSCVFEPRRKHYCAIATQS